MPYSNTYVVLLDPPHKILEDKTKLSSLEKEIPLLLKSCFNGADIEDAEDKRNFLNLPVNETYFRIYFIKSDKKITQEQRKLFEQYFFFYRSKKILRLEDILK